MLFPCDLTKIPFAKHLWVTASAMYPLLFVTSILATKNVPFDLIYLKYFRGKHCELLVNSSFKCVTRGGKGERETQTETETETEREVKSLLPFNRKLLKLIDC